MKNINLITLKGAMTRHKKEVVIIAGLFIFVIAMGLTCAFNVTKEIKVVVNPNTASTGEKVQTSKVTASLTTPVEEVLQSEGVTINDDYTVDTDLSKMAKDVDVVTVKKNAKGVIVADGKEIAYNTADETISDLLTNNGITVDADDEVSPAATSTLTTDVTTVTVSRVDVKEETREQELPFETVEQENPDLDSTAENVLTPGVNGTQTVVDKVTYKDGAEVGRTNVSTTTTKEPVSQVVERGTKLAGGGNLTSDNPTQDPGDDFDTICAIVAHEGGTSYEGALAVISCVMNRADTGAWGGTTALSVLTAPGQFASYLDGYYSQYMGADIPEVRQAVTDCMVGGKRSHHYLSFRSYETSGSQQIAGGNWYFNEK